MLEDLEDIYDNNRMGGRPARNLPDSHRKGGMAAAAKGASCTGMPFGMQQANAAAGAAARRRSEMRGSGLAPTVKKFSWE